MTRPAIEGVVNPLGQGLGGGVAEAASGTQQTADLFGDAIAAVCPLSSKTHLGTTHVLTATWLHSFFILWGVLPAMPKKAYVSSMNFLHGIVSYCV